MAGESRTVYGHGRVGAEQLRVADLDAVGEQVVVVVDAAEYEVEGCRPACALTGRDPFARRVVHQREQQDGRCDGRGEGERRAQDTRAIPVSPGPGHRSWEWCNGR